MKEKGTTFFVQINRMNAEQKSMMLFLTGCIPARLGLAYLAKTLPATYLPYMGMIAILPAIGFLFLWATGSRKTGAEVFGGSIWWNSLRPIHAALYAIFAFMAIQRSSYAWIVLLLDVFVGIGAFTVHHS
jgi:hypothetical protein